MKRLGLIRIDKMGDLINTLPIDQSESLQNLEVVWAIAEGLKPFVDLSEPRRNVTEVPTKDWRKGLQALRHWIRLHKIETAVIFYAPWWASLALWLEKVPVRIGRRSQWHSFLFLNKTLRQSRSQSEMHEAEYNHELILKTLGESTQESALGRTPTLSLKAPFSRQLLEKFQLPSKNYFVVHPGMAGSAINWPQEKYIETIRLLLVHSVVAITGTLIDEPSLVEIKKEFEKNPRVRWLQNQLDLPSLIYILSQSRAVLAPSTGVAHLAASLGVPTITLFPNNQAQSATRWGPRGDQVTVLDLETVNSEMVAHECLKKI